MSSVTHEPGSITGQASLSFTGKAQVPKRLRLISLGVAACQIQVMGVERPRRVEVRLLDLPQTGRRSSKPRQS